jgi:Fur family ferric uptake transcriptional regulator
MQRNTRQRQAILDTIEHSDKPLAPGDILIAARKQYPRLGIATVYRAIRDLVKNQIIIPVDIPGQPTHYERCGLKHHHHFVCTRCEGVFILEGCGYSPTQQGVPKGFLVEAHELILYGCCEKCR